MISGGWPRLLGLWLCALCCEAGAITRIDIHVGEIRHPAVVVRDLTASLDMQGRWRGNADFAQGDWGQLAKAAGLPVVVSRGALLGRAEFAGAHTRLEQLRVATELRDVTFGDTAGLHAGERVGGRFEMEAVRVGERWRWQGLVDWQTGEVFWQPLYFPSGGHEVSARGVLSPEFLEVEAGSAKLGGVGRVDFHGRLELTGKSLERLELSGHGLEAGRGYELLVKPFLDKTMLGNLEIAGRADLQAQLIEGGVRAFRLALRDLDVEDKGGRFAFYKVDAELPWARDAANRAHLRFEGGRLLGLPLGRSALAIQTEGMLVSMPEGRIPLLDGVLTLKDVFVGVVDGTWRGHLGAALSPVSMGAFSHAMGWPRMEGTLALTAPLVTYVEGRLAADGVLKFEVFDGTVTVDNLVLHDPLGRAPRLYADIVMRNLDLDPLTRTFSFGAMRGRLDGDVRGLQLSSWRPVEFDASFRSSPGDYPKKISQRAVENISALGGAGAAAAIQRSFLRFFREFNYARIGLSCRLRNGVCMMDGIEPAQHGYVIVKGSGVPAITVLGYNRQVGWDELLERLKRVTAGNAPIIE
ncbi:MAG: hypothetical protein N2Z69_01010 [Methylophilaceae bacterium]|nr:hypothetical protein [Methylophilaceae bacterium]